MEENVPKPPPTTPSTPPVSETPIYTPLEPPKESGPFGALQQHARALIIGVIIVFLLGAGVIYNQVVIDFFRGKAAPTPGVPAPVSCSPSTQTVGFRQAASLTASGGDGATYEWYAPGCGPFNATGKTFTTTCLNVFVPRGTLGPQIFDVLLISTTRTAKCQIVVNPNTTPSGTPLPTTPGLTRTPFPPPTPLPSITPTNTPVVQAPFNLTAQNGSRVCSGPTTPIRLVWRLLKNDPTLTFNVKRSDVSGGPYQIIKSGVNFLTYNDLPATSGRFYYVVTAVNLLKQESAHSNEASAMMDIPQCTTPTP